MSLADSINTLRSLCKPLYESKRSQAASTIPARKTHKSIVDSYYEFERFFLEHLGCSCTEVQIAHDVLKGHTYKHVAKKLRISESGVKYHMNSIYSKCHVRSKRAFALLVHDAMERWEPDEPSSPHAMNNSKDMMNRTGQRLKRPKGAKE